MCALLVLPAIAEPAWHVPAANVRVSSWLSTRPLTIPVPESWQQHQTARAFSHKGAELATRAILVNGNMLAVEVTPEASFPGEFYGDVTVKEENGKSTETVTWKKRTEPKQRTPVYLYLGDGLETQSPDRPRPLILSLRRAVAHGRPMSGEQYLSYSANEPAPAPYAAWHAFEDASAIQFPAYIAASKEKQYVHYRVESFVPSQLETMVTLTVEAPAPCAAWYVLLDHKPVMSWFDTPSGTSQVMLKPGLNRMTMAAMARGNERMPKLFWSGISQTQLAEQPGPLATRCYAGSCPGSLTFQRKGERPFRLPLKASAPVLFTATNRQLQTLTLPQPESSCDSTWHIPATQDRMPWVLESAPALKLKRTATCWPQDFVLQVPQPIAAPSRNRLELTITQTPHVAFERELPVVYSIQTSAALPPALANRLEVQVLADGQEMLRAAVPQSPFQRVLHLHPDAATKHLLLTPQIGGIPVGVPQAIHLIRPNEPFQLMPRGLRLATEQGWAVLRPAAKATFSTASHRPAGHTAIIDDFCGPAAQLALSAEHHHIVHTPSPGGQAIEKFLLFSDLMDRGANRIILLVGRQEQLRACEIRTRIAELRFLAVAALSRGVTPVLVALPPWQGQSDSDARALALAIKQMGAQLKIPIADLYSAAKRHGNQTPWPVKPHTLASQESQPLLSLIQQILE